MTTESNRMRAAKQDTLGKAALQAAMESDLTEYTIVNDWVDAAHYVLAGGKHCVEIDCTPAGATKEIMENTASRGVDFSILFSTARELGYDTVDMKPGFHAKLADLTACAKRDK